MVRVPDSESFGKTRAAQEGVSKDVRDLQRTDGAQYARTLERIRSLVAGLDAQVAAAISANSYTKVQIDAKVWPVGQISGVMAPGQGGTGTGNVHDTTSTGVQRQVYVTPAGLLTTGASSERFKEDIEPLAVDLAAVLALPARQFRWKSDVAAGRDPVELQVFVDDGGADGPPATLASAPVDYGLIAEEAEALGLDFLVRYGPDGIIDGVHYQRLYIAHHEIIRAQQTQIVGLLARTADMEARLKRIEEGTAHAA